jgi:gamma-glutamyltranspeptidase/glutathione hydrolase
VPPAFLRRLAIPLALSLAAACSPAAPAPVVPPPTTALVTPLASEAPSSSSPIAETGAPKFPAGWPYAPDLGAAVGPHGMVATDAALGSKVGSDILAAGGNAMDAAIATAFALAVVHPAAGNLGGGGFMVARIGGAAYALDFRETAPGKASPTMYLDEHGKLTDDSKTGFRASGVPGSVAGLWEAYQKLASKKLTWKQLIAPAIAMAKDGFVVDAALSETLSSKRLADRLKANPAASALFFKDGKAPAPGTTWRDPDLAASLERIADKGAEGFYTGKTAQLLAAEMKKGGGLITLEDLKGYKAKWRTPIEFDYRGHHITSMPPPSSGGITLAMICHIAEGFDLGKMPWHSAQALHPVLESFRRAYVARNQKLGDPDFVKIPTDDLMSTAWATAQRSTIKPDKATPSIELRPEGAGGPAEGTHTTHFSVVDADGNAVGITTTLNWWFGSGVAIPGAGFLMNNEMDDFAAKPGTANSYGLVQGEPNAVAPGKRMLSSMSPTVVTDANGHVELVAGAAGGSTITTTVFQILSNVVDFGLDVSMAVNAPRFHLQDFPDIVAYEHAGLEPSLQQALGAMGYTFKERDHIADAPAIGKGPNGWIGAPEPRHGGARAAGW